MILANTAANRALVRAMAKEIEATAGYVAIVTWNWNCGTEIRIEIGTSDILRCPYIISSWISEGKVGVKIRMLETTCTTDELIWWKDWISHLTELIDRLNYRLIEKGVA